MDHPVLTWLSRIARRAAVGWCLGAMLFVAVMSCGGSVSDSPAPGSSATGGSSSGSGAQAGTGGRGTGSGGSVGSGGASSGTGGSSSTGGSGTGGMAAGTGGAGGAASCAVTVSVLLPQTIDNLTSGKDSYVRVRATGIPPSVTLPVWNIEFLDPPTRISPRVLNDMPGTSIAEFPTLESGHYSVTLSVGAGVACHDGHLELIVSHPPPASFVVRVTPPPAMALDFPAQDKKLLSLESQPPDTWVITLDRGTRRTFSLKFPDQAFGSGYVRVSLPSGLVMEGYTAAGPVVVSLQDKNVYDVLLVPEKGNVAPLLASVSAADSPLSFYPRVLDQGIPVRGSVLNRNGTPVVGARVLLRDGIRPSTMGVSDAAGKFQLWTRSGIASAIIIPPADSGLPEARVSNIPGILVDDNLSDLTMSWDSPARAQFAVVVRSIDGTQPVAGARVRVESEVDAIPRAGTLRVTGLQTTTLVAGAEVRLDETTDATGRAMFPNLPVTAYKITVVPPSSIPDAAITVQRVTLATAGLTATVPLARHLVLTGTLLPIGMTKGVRIVARDRGTGVVRGTGIAAPPTSALVNEQGGYAVSVDPEHQYELIAEPPAGSGLALTVLDDFKEIHSVQPSAPDYPVARGFPFRGQVRADGSDNLLIGGALVQVYCVGSSSCLDPEVAIAETITSPDGTFTVELPAPSPRNAP
ncbi:MAG: hypothetical protein ABJA82_11170 [Myxococcales bacterium]